MTARNLPFFKNRLMTASRDLYLEHGWKMPPGMIDAAMRDPTSFSLAEWQQAKRLGTDPRLLKQTVQSCWNRSDSPKAFNSSLNQHGLFMAIGDKRGLVVIDHQGEVYLRISTEEQRPDRQIDGLATICDELHVERLSAVSRVRPVYSSVLAKLEAGDTLVVWDFDRAYRSTADALSEINALNRRGIGFRIANFPIDTSTPEGYLLLTILSGMSEFERRILSRRTKEGLAAARRRGRVLGRPKKLSASAVSIARQRIAAGEITIKALAAELGVGRSTLSRALVNFVPEFPGSARTGSP